MSFKVGTPQRMQISNVADKSKEAELKRYDSNSDGELSIKEASRYYASKTGGKAPRSLEDVFKLAGGRQHDINTYHQDWSRTLFSYAPNWKGDFNIPGVGAGNMRVGRQTWGAGDRLNVLMDCDLMNRDFVDNKIASATMVVGPKGFSKESGSDLNEAVNIPLNIATRNGYQSWSRGGGSSWVPEKKHLAASIDAQGLRDLANGGDLEFFVKIKTTEGKTHYVNKDGRAFNNFDINANDIKARGNP